MSIHKTFVLIGDPSSGKTSLLSAFLGAEFPENYHPTELGVEEYVATVEDSNGTLLDLSIWDTNGNEDYDRFRRIAYNSHPDGILICFSVVNPESIINVLERWISAVNQFCPNVPVVLVGTQTDLRDDPGVIQSLANDGLIPVSTEIGQDVKDEINACAYFECSSKTGECVPVVFDYIAKKKFMMGKNSSLNCYPCKIV